MAKINSKLINGKVHTYHKITVHSFLMGDVEDPQLYAAEPMWKWQQSEAGKFVMEHAEEQPEWHRTVDYQHYGHRFAITAILEEKKLAEYYLKFGKPNHLIVN